MCSDLALLRWKNDCWLFQRPGKSVKWLIKLEFELTFRFGFCESLNYVNEAVYELLRALEISEFEAMTAVEVYKTGPVRSVEMIVGPIQIWEKYIKCVDKVRVRYNFRFRVLFLNYENGAVYKLLKIAWNLLNQAMSAVGV